MNDCNKRSTWNYSILLPIIYYYTRTEAKKRHHVLTGVILQDVVSEQPLLLRYKLADCGDNPCHGLERLHHLARNNQTVIRAFNHQAFTLGGLTEFG